MYSDFSNSLNGGLPTFADKRGIMPTADIFPPDFPYEYWQEQQMRYQHYWDWWTGVELEKLSPKISKDAQQKKLFPMKMNAIKQFSRKLASVLMGESADSSVPLVRTMVKPRPSPRPVDDKEKLLSADLEFIINEVWTQSSARAIQMEGGTFSQFLGGCVFKLEWRPTAKDARVPIFIKSVMPDHFIPVWQMDDMWNLLEGYWVYEISREEARVRYGIDEAHVMYVEHWTKTTMKITVGSKVIMNEPNPFGFVPFVYIPRLREGHFYGASMVDDIEALVKEYNSRMANIGDTVKNNAQRRRFGFNIFNKKMPKIVFDRDAFLYDMGDQPHYSDAKPEIITEPPVNMPDSLVSWVDDLWRQMLRDASLAPIAFGEDEGSQRSALTLAFRMWPVTAMIDAQRTYWDEGLNLLAKMIITMILIKLKGVVQFDQAITIPADVLKRMTFSQNWNPKIPRDREQIMNDAVLLMQTGAIDPGTALEMIGEIRDVDDVLEKVIAWKKRIAEIEMSMSSQPTDKGAPTEVEAPVAKTGLDGE